MQKLWAAQVKGRQMGTKASTQSAAGMATQVAWLWAGNISLIAAFSQIATIGVIVSLTIDGAPVNVVSGMAALQAFCIGLAIAANHFYGFRLGTHKWVLLLTIGAFLLISKLLTLNRDHASLTELFTVRNWTACHSYAHMGGEVGK